MLAPSGASGSVQGVRRPLRALVLVPRGARPGDPGARRTPLPRASRASCARTASRRRAPGVTIVDLSDGQVIYRHHAWKPLAPASNEKLFTTVAALATLRPDFRFETTVVGVGARAGATWHGDLYLVGSGDPTFSSDDIDDARQAAARSAASATSPGASAATRRSSTACASAPVADVVLRHRVAAALGAHARPRTRRRTATCRRPRAHRRARAAQGADRSRASRSAGVVGDRQGAVGAPELGRVQSEPLWKIVRSMDRHSDNFTAEMVTKAVGALAGGSGTTARGMPSPATVAAADARRRRQAPAPRRRLGPLARESRHRERARAAARRAPRPTRRSRTPLRQALSVAGVNGTLARPPARLRGRVLGKSGHARRRLVALGLRDDAAAVAASRSSILMNVPRAERLGRPRGPGRDRHAARASPRATLLNLGSRPASSSALERLVVEHRDAERLGLRELRARARAGHDVARPLRDRVGDLAAARDDLGGRLVARGRRERARDHEA